MKPTLLVLAAGMGSRYGGLKQIDPVGPSGEIIIDYSVFDAVRAGFGKLVFIIRKEIEADFKSFVGDRYAGLLPVEYAYQEIHALPSGCRVPEGRIKPWGTGHAILTAAETIHEPFAVINADDFYGRGGYEKLSGFLSSFSDATETKYAMCGFRLKNTLSEHGTVSRGLCSRDASSVLTDVEEITKIEKVPGGARYLRGETEVRLTGEEIVSMNMWGFGPSIFTFLRDEFVHFLDDHGDDLKSEFFIPTVVNSLVQSKRATVNVLLSEDSWFGITYREDKPRVVESLRDLVQRGEYPEKLFS